MRKIAFFLLCGCIPFNLIAQEEDFKQNHGKFIANPPYYAQYGYLTRINDLELYVPYIGIGLQKTKFSIAFYAQTGISVYYKNFTWKAEYLQGIVPDISFFDYKNLEYYAQNIFAYDFSAVRILSLTRVGRILHGFHSANSEEVVENIFTDLGVRQVFSLDTQMYNDDLTILTGTFSVGFDFVPSYRQNSIFTKIVIPLTLDFIHSKLGFMGTLFYTAYLSDERSILIGERYSGYDSAKTISQIRDRALYSNLYHLTGTFDMIYRIYLRSLPSPYDRIYFAVGGNVGFGYHVDTLKTDLLYMGTVAFGYELYDTIPFEIRFSVDQYKNFFVNLNIVSPISHRFDSRPK